MTNPIWTKHPHESSKAFSSFEAYRDMADRSIQKVGEKLAKNPKSLAKLSKKYEWPARTRAFDEYISQRKSEEMIAEIIEMNRRHALQAQSFEEIALTPLHELKSRIDRGETLWCEKGMYRMETTKVAEYFFKCFKI